ncbi:MAG: ribosomal-protein-alanine N-acetyltransferase [Lachnoclostridium sp.]|nr:ribosomal-protein-alanine N-acetyltransferase [Lachnoclostridium sp.]
MTTVRKMTADDVAALAELERICFSDAWSENIVRDLTDSSWDEVWVLEAETILGYINYRFIAGEGELMRIAVLPEQRGHGYSRKLMDVMMNAAAQNQITDLTLEVRAGNEPAIGLYKAYGFVEEAVRKNYYHNPTEDALIMWLRGLPSIPT